RRGAGQERNEDRTERTERREKGHGTAGERVRPGEGEGQGGPGPRRRRRGPGEGGRPRPPPRRRLRRGRDREGQGGRRREERREGLRQGLSAGREARRVRGGRGRLDASPAGRRSAAVAGAAAPVTGRRGPTTGPRGAPVLRRPATGEAGWRRGRTPCRGARRRPVPGGDPGVAAPSARRRGRGAGHPVRCGSSPTGAGLRRALISALPPSRRRSRGGSAEISAGG